MPQENRLLDAAREAVNSLGLSDFKGVMRELFHKPYQNGFDLRLHETIWQINSRLVITTNYDSSLEWEKSSVTRVLNHQKQDLVGLLDLNSISIPTIWHIHGHISDVGSLILAPEQYDRFYSNSNMLNDYAAAKKQLQALVGNYPLLFVGFGLNDEYVLTLIGETFAQFDTALRKSFALLKKGENATSAIWEKYNIQVIEYEDHGEPLFELMQSIAKPELPITSKATTVAAKVPVLDSVDNLPFSKCKSIPTRIIGLGDLISSLENHFSFRWEKSPLPPAAKSEIEPTIVYWPIRLRAPSAIHGVQAFAAAALQRYSAQIILCLDDLGDQKFGASSFRNRIKHWFTKVGVEPNRIDFRLFSEILNTQDRSIAWDHVQKWLGGQGYDLRTVLEICKLYNLGMEPVEFLSRGTGRLLTPGVVWACLSHLLSESPNANFITLGGYDERNLWKAWREKIDQGVTPVSHLYIPELSNTHMEKVDLKWLAKSDIENTIREKAGALKGPSDWNSANEILKWSVTGCVQLPSYVRDGCKSAVQVNFDPNGNLQAITQAATNKIAEWML